MKYPLWHLDLTMNGYLFGCLVLMAFWLITRFLVGITRKRAMLRELWWGSIACAALGFTEPLFVPSYWNPPSILKLWRWDFESFPFCFAVGGITAVVTEMEPVKGFIVDLQFRLHKLLRGILGLISRATGHWLHARMLDQPPVNFLIPRNQLRIENMLLVTFIVAVFGATGQFGLNIIYQSALVCFSSALMIAWRRPGLRWQILGGGISFTVIYTVVLVLTGQFYPSFYDHWNLAALSGKRFLGAPAEEYLYAFTFGAFWAPLYEAWKQTRIHDDAARAHASEKAYARIDPLVVLKADPPPDVRQWQ
jgi:Lycopene cyclase